MITTTSGTVFNNWSTPQRIEVNEYSDKIEMIYKEISTITYASYSPPPPIERVFKIVFSCVNGVWNKSAPIYGKIISSQNETYQF
jgi:hypothetical protein